MSGGVDSAVAALLGRLEAAREAVASRSSCGPTPRTTASRAAARAGGARGARARARARHAPPLDRPARRVPGRRRRGLARGARRRADAQPVRALQRQRAARRDARARRAARRADALATGHYARVASTTAACPLLRTPPTARKDQSYVLAGARPSSLARLRFPARRAATRPRCASSPRARGWPSPGSATRRTCASSPAQARGAFLERHGKLAPRPGRSLDRAGRVLGEHAGAHRYTVGQRHGLGVGERDAALRARDRRGRANAVTVGPREELRAERSACATSVLHRAGGEVDGVQRALARTAGACRMRDRGSLSRPDGTRAPSVDLPSRRGAHRPRAARVPVSPASSSSATARSLRLTRARAAPARCSTSHPLDDLAR